MSRPRISGLTVLGVALSPLAVATILINTPNGGDNVVSFSPVEALPPDTPTPSGTSADSTPLAMPSVVSLPVVDRPQDHAPKDAARRLHPRSQIEDETPALNPTPTPTPDAPSQEPTPDATPTAEEPTLPPSAEPDPTPTPSEPASPEPLPTASTSDPVPTH